MANVIFKVGSLAQYKALEKHDVNTLYWLEDVQQIYKGDVLYASGALATSVVSGLMSAEDKAKLDSLKSGVAGLTPVDKSILLVPQENGEMGIGIGLSKAEGNILELKDDGLYAASGLSEADIPVYTVEKQATAEEGYATSYKLKKTVNGESEYVGDTINVAKDMVLQSATMEVVTEAGKPYEGAEVGDPYIDMLFNDSAQSHVYVPLKGLIDEYTAGLGIEIVDRKVSLKLHPVESRGLFVDENGLGLGLATAETAGAMSPEHVKALEAVPATYLKQVAAKALYLPRQYEITNKLDNILVNYRDHEIRVFAPADTQWVKQNVGATGDGNMYYIGFRAYAPSEDVVSFKEDMGDIINDQTMHTFDGDFSGVDQYGRKYSICWLAVAKYDETTGSWSYFGDNSTVDHYIGWTYNVEWYNAAGVKVGADKIRINLTNEALLHENTPYYVQQINAKVTNVTTDVEVLKTDVYELKEAVSWSTI